jgi:hypothetical protein
VKGDERSNKIVYEIVKSVGDRAGVTVHPHALRAAFAVHFLETAPNRIQALKELMGHDDIGTTMTYLRRFNRSRDMEVVRGLSWSSNRFPPTGAAHSPEPGRSQMGGAEGGESPETPAAGDGDFPSGLPPEAVEAHTGFEPVFSPDLLVERIRSRLRAVDGGVHVENPAVRGAGH